MLPQLAQQIIDRLQKYNANLAENTDFYHFTTTGWKDSPKYDQSLGEPEWPCMVKNAWSVNITTQEQFEKAFGTTIYWRWEIGLDYEDYPKPDKPVFKSYETCPAEVKEVGKTYDQYIFGEYDDMSYE